MKLALALGCSVREAQERIDSREFSEWIAYWNIEPWGEERADLRAGIVSATVANAASGRRGRPFVPSDFMPLTKPKSQRQTPQEMDARILAYVKAHNEAVNTGLKK